MLGSHQNFKKGVLCEPLLWKIGKMGPGEMALGWAQEGVLGEVCADTEGRVRMCQSVYKHTIPVYRTSPCVLDIVLSMA